jgi:hypothetical protein
VRRFENYYDLWQGLVNLAAAVRHRLAGAFGTEIRNLFEEQDTTENWKGISVSATALAPPWGAACCARKNFRKRECFTRHEG